MTDPVSRETQVPPAAASVLFGARLATACRFADLLASEGIDRGLIGPREVPRLWDRHLLNCALLARELPSGVSVADVGSGAGLPGLVLAIARPDVTVTLIEPLLRRTTFLDDVVAELGLQGQMRVVRARAEGMPTGERFDIVTARAVAPLAKLVTWCLPLVAVGGELWAMKGDRAEDELREAVSTIGRSGGVSVGVESYGADLAVSPTNVVRVRRSR